MSRREIDKDLERPHFYSQYWITIARHYARTGSLANLPTVMEETEEDEIEELPPMRPVARTVTAPPPAPAPEAEPDIEELPLPLARPTPKPAKPKPEPKASSLNSLAELAAIGFGNDMETEELPVSDDDDTESVISRLGSNFDNDEDFGVQPDEEEAASLESLSEEEDWDEDEEEDDTPGGHRRPTRPTKPQRPRRDRF
jgi:hypothetical protein